MAQVTIELRNVLKMKDFELFDFDYPICDSSWKREFENLFKNYFYFYEIGAETIDRFKHNLKTRLRLIMPYYNELYKSTLFELDPLLSKKIKETYSDTRESNSTDKVTDNSISTSNTDNNDERVETDYPQHTNIEDDIPTNKAKNSIRQNTKGKVDYSSNRNNIKKDLHDYERVIEGFEGNQNELLKSYRQNIININKLLIEDLKILFILVY